MHVDLRKKHEHLCMLNFESKPHLKYNKTNPLYAMKWPRVTCFILAPMMTISSGERSQIIMHHCQQRSPE